MNLSARFLLDYETLFVNHDLITEFSDTLLMIPYSSFKLFNQMITETLNSNEFSDEDKKLTKKYFKPFIDLVYSNETVLQQIIRDNAEKSSAICIDTVNKIFMCFVNVEDKAIDLGVNPDILSTFDKYDLDVLKSSKYFDCPIFTTSEGIKDTIVTNNIQVDYVFGTR